MWVDHQVCVEMRKALERALDIKKPGYILVSLSTALPGTDIMDTMDRSTCLLVQFIKCHSRIRSKFTQFVYKCPMYLDTGYPVLWVPPIRDKGSKAVECVCLDSIMYYIRNTY